MDKNIAARRGEALIGNTFVSGQRGSACLQQPARCSARPLPSMTNDIASTAEVELSWHAASGSLLAGFIGSRFF